MEPEPNKVRKEAGLTNDSTPHKAAAQNKPSAIEDRRSRLSQWPMIVGLTFLWAALWQDFTPSTIVLGIIFSTLVMLFFAAPGSICGSDQCVSQFHIHPVLLVENHCRHMAGSVQIHFPGPQRDQFRRGGQTSYARRLADDP